MPLTCALGRPLVPSEVRDLEQTEQRTVMLPTDSHAVQNGEKLVKVLAAVAAVICKGVAIRRTQDAAPALLASIDLTGFDKSIWGYTPSS